MKKNLPSFLPVRAMGFAARGMTAMENLISVVPGVFACSEDRREAAP